MKAVRVDRAVLRSDTASHAAIIAKPQARNVVVIQKPAMWRLHHAILHPVHIYIRICSWIAGAVTVATGASTFRHL